MRTVGWEAGRERFWELLENTQQRRRRARLIRAIYALVDPGGWDARRHFPGNQVAAALAALGHEKT